MLLLFIGAFYGGWIFDTKTGASEFVPIECRAFVELSPDLTVEDEAEWLLSPDIEFADYVVENAIVKLTYTATAEQAKRIDHRKLRDALYAAGAHKVYAIEAQVERETRARVEGVDESLGEMDALDAYIEAQEIDPKMAAALRRRTDRYLQEVGS